MTFASQWPRIGDAAVELRRSARAGEPDQVGHIVFVSQVTETLVITSSGDKYNLDGLFPAAEGRHSPRVLLPATDIRVLTAQGRHLLGSVAMLAANLAALDRRNPEECVGALAAITAHAHRARVELLRLMTDASRREQESER